MWCRVASDACRWRRCISRDGWRPDVSDFTACRPLRERRISICCAIDGERWRIRGSGEVVVHPEGWSIITRCGYGSEPLNEVPSGAGLQSRGGGPARELRGGVSEST